MKAAFIYHPGPAEDITYGDLPKPLVSGSQVLVRVAAVSVNPVDTYIRSGAIDMGIPTPFVVGCDVAGVVEELGPDATRFQVGDRVWGSNQGLLGRQGTFAEYAAVDESWLYPTPTDVSHQDAAAAALVSITAHLGLARDAKLREGETLFVNGGSGGVGSSVVQMAKAMGARVITTAGSDPKVAVCRQLGADLAINYRAEDVDRAIREFAPDGIDVWWETLREPDLVRTVDFLRPRGRIILMAGREALAPLPIGPFYVKDCSIHGFAMFNAPSEQQRESAEAINGFLADGSLKPRIDRVMPLSETAAAHRLQEENTLGSAGTLSGKIVLEP